MKGELCQLAEACAATAKTNKILKYEVNSIADALIKKIIIKENKIKNIKEKDDDERTTSSN